MKDAAAYIMKLPKAEHSAPEWQAAMEALILVAENGGPAMLARIGVTRALNRHVEQVFDPDLKMPHWGKRNTQQRPMTVFVYVNTSKQVGDAEHLKVFPNEDGGLRKTTLRAWPSNMKFWKEKGRLRGSLTFVTHPARNRALEQLVPLLTSSCRIRVGFFHIARGQRH